MTPLFSSRSDIPLVSTLNGQQKNFGLLATPDVISQIYYETRDDREKLDFEFQFHTLSHHPLSALHDKMSSGEHEIPALIVADGDGESDRVKQLKGNFPQLQFYGLAEEFLPALLAKQIHRLPEIHALDLSKALDVVLLFATPRSGSSLVGDVLTDLGVGNTAEHLRATLVECLGSAYKFNDKRALRIFLSLSSNNGWVGTKIISHFLMNYLEGPFNSMLFSGLAADGHRLHPIFLRRRNQVLQAVSGFLASKRGVWHVTDAKSKSKLGEKESVPYDFNALFRRFTAYRAQEAFLDSFSQSFPGALKLTYEDDCTDIEALAKRLSRHLALKRNATLQKAKTRKKIASRLNDEMEASFRDDYRNLFGASVI